MTTMKERTLRVAFGFMIVAFLLVGCAAAAHGAGTEFYHGKEVAAGEVLVKFRAAAPEVISETQIGENADETEYVGSTQAMRFHSRSKNVETLISELSARGDVEYAEPNYVVHALDTMPNDPLYGQLWAMPKIGAPSAWAISTGSATNVVGVVDTGIDYNHADLAANVWTSKDPFTVTIGSQSINCPANSHGFNAITNTCDPMDDYNHGTHVSGTIGAVGNNGVGVVGVNWKASVMGLKFLDARGSGYTSDAIDAIEFAIQVKQKGIADIRVLSNSWGGGGYSQALYDEISRANDNDILFVAAAGNSASNNDVTPNYPSNYDVTNVIAVAATDSNDKLASFSSYGATTVDLGAPGVNIESTIRNGGYGYMSGTSMATPHVSGAAALILSKCALSTADLRADILSSVDPVSSLAGKTVTGGRLNVNKAILACGGSPTIPTTTMLSASPASSTYGESVTFTATVTPQGGSGTPTGTVIFYNESTALGITTLASGKATITTSTLSGALHSITATYGGDSSFGGSSTVISYTVNPAITSTILTSSPNPSTFGQQVTFTATVTPSSGSGTPTGTVTFYDGAASLGTVTLSSGSGSLSTSTLVVGSHSITATYNGNSNYQTSSSTAVPLTVGTATSTTSLASSANPSIFGQSVTFTATVSPSAATGTVTFLDGSTQLGTATLVSGKVTFSTSSLSVGSHTITAKYSGDTNVASSTSSPIVQTVNPVPPGDFSLSASPSSRTVTRGSSTTYTATITRQPGFTGQVGFTVAGLPSGASGTFSPKTVSNPGTLSTLRITTSSRTQTGTYTVTITGTSGSLIHSATVTLRITR